MKKILISLAFLCTVTLGAAAGDKVAKPLKVISFNIRLVNKDDGTNNWLYRYPATFEMMEKEMPDVMGVQEMLPMQREMIKEYFNGKYKCIGVGREDGKSEGECMGIWYNPKTISILKWGTFWLSETPSKPSKGWDGACYRTATWAVCRYQGKKFIIVNTHLDHVGEEAQRNGIELVAARAKALAAKEKLPIVITGDFNLDENRSVLIDDFSAQFCNARRTAAETDKSYTFNGWGRSQSTIDYIFYEGFTCSSFSVLKKKYAEKPFISDHFPCRAEFEF